MSLNTLLTSKCTQFHTIYRVSENNSSAFAEKYSYELCIDVNELPLILRTKANFGVEIYFTKIGHIVLES